MDYRQFNNLNNQYRYRNRNPVFQGGMTQVQTPLGAMNVPIAWMQQLAFNRQYGGGGYGSFFGGVGRNQYGSNAIQQQFLRQISPRYQNQGALDPYTTAQQRMMSYERPARLRSNQYAAETVNNMGQGIRAISPAEQARQEQQKIFRSGMFPSANEATQRRALVAQQDSRRRMFEDMNRFQSMRPTTSNLRIQERVVR